MLVIKILFLTSFMFSPDFALTSMKFNPSSSASWRNRH